MTKEMTAEKESAPCIWQYLDTEYFTGCGYFVKYEIHYMFLTGEMVYCPICGRGIIYVD